MLERLDTRDPIELESQLNFDLTETLSKQKDVGKTVFEALAISEDLVVDAEFMDIDSVKGPTLTRHPGGGQYVDD